jgi:hypothetical protein
MNVELKRLLNNLKEYRVLDGADVQKLANIAVKQHEEIESLKLKVRSLESIIEDKEKADKERENKNNLQEESNGKTGTHRVRRISTESGD